MSTAKTIFSDIDETLLNNDKVLTDRTKQAIINVMKRGHRVIVISGAPFTHHAPRFAGTDVEYIATSNGGALYRIRDGKLVEVIHESKVAHDVIFKICEPTEDLWDEVLIQTKEAYYRPKTITELRECIKDKTVTQFTPQGLNFDKMKKFGEFTKDLIAKNNLYVANYAKPFQDIKFWDSGETKWLYYDIVNKGTAKENAVKKFSELLNINKKDTIAIGDGFNDIKMLKTVGYGVAMGNAVQSLKDIADYITDTNQNDGAAQFFDTIK